MDNKWYMKLKGEDADFEDIKRNLKTYEWSLFQDDDGTYLTNKTLDNISDVKDVELKFDDFIDILNGALNCIYSNFNTVSKAHLIKYDKKSGSRNIYMKVTSSINIRFRAELSITGDNSVRKTTVEKWLELAEKNYKVKSALHFYKAPTWSNLYKILEVIAEDVGSKNKSKNNIQALKKKNYVPEKDISRFTGTVQSRIILGDDARHAASKFKGHNDPMELNEAKSMVKTIFQKWIDEK